MDPVLQTFQQQSSGSAEGQGFGNFFIQGQQLNLSRQHLELAKKAEARAKAEQDALLPLQKQLMQYKAINDGLQLGKIVTDADVTTEINSAIPKVNDLLARFMRSKDGFNDSDLLSEYNTLFAQVPWVFSGGNGAKVTQGIEAARAQRTMWVSALEHEKDLKERGLYLQEITGKGEMRFGLRDEEDRRLKRQNEIIRLQNEATRLAQSGDRNALANVRLRIQALEQGVELGGMQEPSFGAPSPSVQQSNPAAPNNSSTVNTIQQPPTEEFGPQPAAAQSAQPAPITIQQVARPTTPAATTKFQEKSVALDNAIGSLDRVIQDIQENPDAFGLVGAGKSLAEKATGLIDPNADSRIRTIRNRADIAFSQTAPGLRVDSGNMSRYELTQLENAAKLTGVTDNPSYAIEKATNIRNAAVAQKLRLDKDLHKPVDPNTLSKVPTDDIPEMVKSRLIDRDGLKELWRQGKISSVEQLLNLYRLIPTPK